MFRRTLFRLAAWLILAALLLSGCGAGSEDLSGEATPTPLPTTTAPEFPVVATQSCELARFAALRTRQAQGDLIAWAPDSRSLAFIGPDANSNWFSGRLYLASLSDVTQPVLLSGNALVFGDLSWAPDGERLAYIIFRPPDAYSVAVVAPGSSAALDLFAENSAQTDFWSSSKALQSWRSSSVLRVLSSCGPDCDQTYEIDLNSGQVGPVGEQTRKSKTRLWPEPNELEYDAALYPLMVQDTWENRLAPQMKRPTWTPDGSKVAYIDRFLTAWVLRVDLKQQYMLDTPYVDVQELKWSPDGRYLGLRTDDDIYIYDTECAQQK